jgi:thymidylate kinase
MNVKHVHGVNNAQIGKLNYVNGIAPPKAYARPNCRQEYPPSWGEAPRLPVQLMGKPMEMKPETAPLLKMDMVAASHDSSPRVKRLFEAFAGHSLPSCIWKSRDRWEEGQAGKTDIDLLIDADHFSSAIEILIREDWVLVEAEPWRRFPGLVDFVTFEKGKCLHLHLHERIVAGEKMVKSMRPPLTDLYLQHTFESYPPFVEPELEFILFIARITLKISLVDILGAFKRRSKAALYRNYVKEYDLLRAHCDRARITALLREPQLQRLPAGIILSAYDSLTSLDMYGRRALRRSIARWRVYGDTKVFLLGLWRHFLKKQQGVGKLLPSSGVSLAICGPDGSGKTTLADAVQKEVARQLSVRRFYMGGNMKQPGRLRGAIMKSLWLFYLPIRKCFKIAHWRDGVRNIEALYSGLNQLLMHKEKQRRLRRSRKSLEKGEVVLFERFPLFFPYGDDMRRSVHDAADGSRVKPDLLFILNVTEKTACARRAGEDLATIKQKVADFRWFSENPGALSDRLVMLDGEASVQQNVDTVLCHLGRRLAAGARSPAGIS